MQSITFSGQITRSPFESHPTLHIAPDKLAKCGSIINPLGQTPARGWYLLRKEQLDAIDLNGTHTVVYDDDKWGTVTLYNLIVCREPSKIHYSMNTSQADSVFLVEVSDQRWLLHNPIYHQSLNKTYNVRARGWGNDHYDDSTNSGTAWTWTEMVEDIWTEMSFLGSYPGLPSSPSGTPEGWIFQGVSAWMALCQVLDTLGMAVQCDLTQSSGQYSIVDYTGSEPSTIQELIDAERMVHDAEFQSVSQGRLPIGCRVHFHAIREHAGTERTTPIDSEQWITSSVYTVDVAGPDTSGATGIYHPIWNGTPAIYDATGSLTNSATLATIAAEETADWFSSRRSTGGDRNHQIFDGAANLIPGSTIRAVTYRYYSNPQEPTPHIATEIIRHPLRVLNIDNDTGEMVFEDSTKEHPPDLRPTFPEYPELVQIVKIANGTPTGSLYDSTVETCTTAPNTFTSEESVWVIDLDGATSLTANARYTARLITFSSSRPVYAIRSASSLLTVEEEDGSPSASGVDTIVFDQADGFSVTDDGGGQVTIGFSGGGSITVEEVDGTPSVSNVSTLRFDQSDGFIVTDDGGNQATVTLSVASSLTVRESDTSPSVSNVTIINFNQSDGFAVTDNGGGQCTISYSTTGATGTDLLGTTFSNGLATAIGIGPLAPEDGGTGLSTPPDGDGQLLIGSSGGGYLHQTLTEGTGIVVTNGANSITLDLDETGGSAGGVAYYGKDISGDLGFYAIPFHTYNKTAAPGSSDDDGSGYSPGSLWVDTTNDDAYICLDATTSSAVWKKITP